MKSYETGSEVPRFDNEWEIISKGGWIMSKNIIVGKLFQKFVTMVY
jgi:hypothetical protein